jgi:cell wall-associated NlpC family hydrolase
MATAAAQALASGTGGAAAGGEATPSKPRLKSKPKPLAPRGAAPVTSRSSNLTYTGPVFEKTGTGEIVPYEGQTTSPPGALTGGSAVGVAATVKPELLVPGARARYVNGIAAAPISAPAAIQQIIWAGDEIIGRPYVYGGGHGSFDSSGYDCSGTVSFALHGANLLATPEDSSELMAWASSGIGRWVTIFSNPGHAYMTVAGLRLDTSAADDPSQQQGPRWRPLRASNEGYAVRHPLGL